MQLNYLKAILRTAAYAATVLLLGAGVAGAQQAVNLSAGPTTTTLPDGSVVPMWGYSCGAAVAGSTATCAAANPSAGANWSPVVITVPTGQNLQISLTNNLSFSNGNTVPTSLVIVGQLGGGLGTTATSTPSSDHSNAQGATTWPIAGGPGATAPTQGNRVQSFSTEVAPGATTALTWTAPRPGTYLLESGTHPSIQGSMGLIGVVVVTTAPSGTTAGTAYPAAGTVPAITYSAELPLVFGEIDPVQNNAVSAAVNTAGFSETMVWSGLAGGCGVKGSATYNQCYPPVVNYTPLYYLINGVAFNKSSATTSLFAALPPGSATTPVTGNVLVRFVNAGLRMHVPSIVGSVTGTTPAGGFSLIAEDGNPLPGLARVQSEVFMAAGKTYDVMLNVPATGATALPVYDRQLSLSGNGTARDAGMLAYIGVNGSGVPAAPALGAAVANPDSYGVVPGNTLTVSDPGKGVIANDVNVYGVKVTTAPTQGALTLNADGTFTYVPNAGWSGGDSFVYQANGNGPTATVTLGAAAIESAGGIVMNPMSYTANTATFLKISSPGILSVDKDGAGYPLTVNATSVTPATGLTLTVDPNGGFNAKVAAPGTYTFTYKAQNSQGTVSATAATVTLIFPNPSNLAVNVVDGNDHTTAITDYRWIIEEDRTFYVDPNCTTNPPAAGCPTAGGIVPTFGTNFHTSYMPVIATGCTGPLSCESGQTVLGQSTVCDIGNGICEQGLNAGQETAVNPSQVVLDPLRRYYISVLPGDAANPFETANATKGHGMGGAPIAAHQTAVTVLAQPTPFPPAKLSVFVFEDDFPLNGEQDGGGGVDVLSPNEPGLGSFNITIMDDAGGPGDATGQVDYDMFNQPLANALAGTLDPVTHVDACPISKTPRAGTNADQTGITGTIVTCPKYESDGVTLSPLAGQAVVANMMPGRYGIIATPAADRIARGEEWLQTNTLDGQKAHDSFLKIGEAGYFQEYGPAGYHVSIGFANPKIINGRKSTVCGGTDPNLPGTGNCTNSVTGLVTTERMSRTPDERLYSSGDNSSFSFTQCYVSFGDADGEDFAFTKCNADGTFTLTGLPDGDWRITVFDQWNDMLVDGLSTPVRLAGGALVNLGQLAINQWQANIYTTTFFDTNKNGVRDPGEDGLALVPTNVRFRDGSFSNFNNTDLDGYAGFNEEFPLFNWYVVETDPTRYKNTGTHVVYDAGGPADGTPCGTAVTPAAAPCGSSTIASMLANTAETISVPTALRVPGAVYCKDADCSTHPTGILGGPASSDPPAACTTSSTGTTTCTTSLSTGRIDPAWVLSEGWQGYSGQNSFLEFGKTPYAAGENGGIRGHVVYASTRPFDDPTLLLQLSWEPLIPNVTINLYKEGTAPDGTTSLTMVDSTKTSSFDDWAQGVRSDDVPNMNCPGQGTDSGTNADLFYFSLFNQPNWLDTYNATYNGGTLHTIPNNSQFKCYDGMHNWNQLQPAPYDGMYQFPSIAGRNPTTGVPVGGTGSVAGTNCTMCVANPTDGTPMLPKGKYVVEVVVPSGYELVKEEDKNILIGDNFIAPVTVEFPGLGGSIFILPDQATVANTYNGQNQTNNLGRVTLPSHEADTGQLESYWPCVGAARVVPDFISLFPGSAEVAPFAGSTRNLCDRKEVQLDDQTSALAKFYLFTSTHAAAHFAGVITDDYTSEFDPYSPQFGEKFAPPDLPISIKDWTGNEVSRVYSDHWGAYNGLTYSTWEVNPPNPTGYSPTMMVTCMNDPGTAVNPTTGLPAPDPLFNPQYSQFCYEIPFMPGQTQYMDTPVVPTSAFAGAGYNNPDCSYPDLTPAVASVTSADIAGPWVSAAGHTITIIALGDQMVPNNAYAGPSATTAPYNQKKISRHYGFGASQGTGTVTIGGKTATVSSWSDLQIMATVPTGVANCGITQQSQYGGSTAQCGELLITAGNGKQSVDAVTVTIGGKKPTVLAAGSTIQSAIDTAAPGDMIIVPSGLYTEMILMWKPVRLQGVGAASSIINANTHPEGRLDDWRRRVNCLFGLALNGTPIAPPSATNPVGNPYDPTGTFTCGTGLANFKQFDGRNPQVDRLPLEATVGWDATLNGNLAELLQEPTLMGALEGAAITVLSKGVTFPSNPFAADTFPTGTQLLDGSTNSTHGCGANTATAKNPFPSNFQCNPSRIDGLGITDSSQGGGGIFVHAWGHYLEISNNRVNNNAGTLSGGINVGQGEFPPAYLAGTANAALNAAPGSCESAGPAGLVLPYCHDIHVNIHNNAITSNSSTGDELFSATPAGAGGVSFCTGSDYYQFNYNWVCGNLSTGDGGGLGHLGFIKNGDIEHNSFLFNQSTNPTIPTNGGGVLIMGAPDVDPPCATLDQDCVGATNLIGPSDGSGPGTVINANLIMGNSADSGSGGGLRLQNINGSDVVAFPTSPANWNTVSVTNNIITNNVAGWDGAGISILDALNTNIINNTIASNDTTASSGVLFNTLGAPLASANGPCGTDPNTGLPATNPCVTTSTPQPAGLVSIQNSAVFSANLPATITCPANHGGNGTGTNGLTNGDCRRFSVPELYNNVLWQNRTFHIGVGTLGNGGTNQQNVVSLYVGNTTTPAPSQPQTVGATANGAGVVITGGTGACVPGAATNAYWDLGVRGDTGPSNHSGGTLVPTYSVITDVADYSTAALHNSGGNPTFASQYCNGSRVPPELGSMGYQVPPGISDATVPNPIFSLTPAATVDEGNNWINLSWGPLALTSPANTTLANYRPTTTSSTINYIPSTATTYAAAPSTDFFGNPRKTNNAVDAGAVEFATAATATLSVTPTSLAFGNVARGTTSAAQNLTLSNTGGAQATGITVVVTAPFSRSGGTCGATLNAGATCTIGVVFSPVSTTTAATGSATIAASVAVTGSPVSLTGTGIAGVVSASLTPTSHAFGNATRGVGALTAPTQVFTLTNTGNVPLTGIGQGALGGTNATEFSIVRLTSTCGPAGGGQLLGQTTLAPGATCVVTVQFRPLTAQTTGAKTATVSLTDLAGTQTSTLSGTAQ